MPDRRLNEWPTGGRRYLPLESSEFAQLVTAAHRVASGIPADDQPLLLEATYQAKLAAGNLLVGTANLQIVQRSAETAILALEPCSLALTQPRWIPPDAEAAVLGQFAGRRFALMVDRSGILNVTWSLRGTRNAQGDLVFSLRLPASPVKHLQIALPQGLLPVTDHGLVRKTSVSAAGDSVWQLELGSRIDTVVRITSDSARAAWRRSPSARQLTTYNIQLRGTELTSQWTLTEVNQTCRELTFSVDPRVRIIAATSGGVEVPWSVSRTESTSHAQVRVPLRRVTKNGSSDAFAKDRFVVQLIGVAALETKRQWRLPQIHCDTVAWESGRMRLLVANPLVVKQLDLNECRQTRSEPIAAPGSGESLEIEAFSQAASIEIKVAPPDAHMAVRSGTTLVLGAHEVTGRVVAECTTTGRGSHTFSAGVTSGWIVEAVATVPSNVLANWSVERASDGASLLEVQFNEGLPARRSIRLIVNGRLRRSALDRHLPATALQVLRPTAAATGGPPLMLIRAVDPFELRLTGDARLRFRNPADLSSQDAALIEDPRRGLLFDVDWNVKQLQVAVVRRTPRFSAEINVEATVLSESVEETFRFRCVPDASRLQRLLIGFSQAIHPPLRVTLAGPVHQDLAARPVVVDPSSTNGANASSQVWEVTLPKPFSTPFEIQATHIRPRVDPVQATLASTPDATVQRGRIAVRTASLPDLVIEPRRLKPIPLPIVAPGTYAPVRAMFRYEPARNALATTQPVLILRSAEELRQQPLAWIWRVDVDTRGAPAGTTRHLATYRIENRGRRTAIWTIPLGTRLMAAWLDNVKLPFDAPTDGEVKLHVDLPLGQRFPIVLLDLTCEDQSVRVTARQRPPVPQSDLPIVASQWTLWLPPGFEVVGDGTNSQRVAAPTIRQRLFGPLAPAVAWQPFDPFRRRDWAELRNRRVSAAAAQQTAQRLLERIAAASHPTNSRRAPTWRQVLAATVDETAGFGIPLLVDEGELARRAVTQASPLPIAPAARPPRAAGAPLGATLLHQQGLALVIQPAAVLLTSAAAAANMAPELIAIGPELQCRYLPIGQYRNAAEASTPGGMPPQWTTASSWCTERPAVVLPWNQPSESVTEAAGWSATTWRNANGQQPSATVVSRWSLDLMALATMAVAALAVCLPLFRFPMTSVGLLAATSVAALLLPASYAAIATGGFLGALLGLACGTRRRPTSASVPTSGGDSSRTDQSSSPATTVGLLLLGLLTSWSGVATAAQPTDRPVPGPASAATPFAKELPAGRHTELPARVHTVLVPTDARGGSVGSRVYISEDFLAALYRQAAIGDRRPHNWVLTGATYVASLSKERLSERLAVDRLEARFDLRIFNRLTNVALPFQTEDPSWVPGSAWLDGRPIKVTWPAEGNGFRVRVSDTGTCQLVIHMRPRHPDQPPPSGLSLTLPRLANARLRLTIPDRLDDLSGLRLPVSAGAVDWDRATGKVDVALGPVRQLTLGRPGDAASTAGVEVEATELLWLHMRPGAVILAAKYKVIPRFGAIDQLHLTADPRLRLLPQEADSPIASAAIQAGTPRRITLKLRQSTTAPLTITTRWLLTGYSGIGNLRMPHLRIDVDRHRRRLLAVSVAAGLIAREDRREPLVALPIADFTREWGEMPEPPQFVYQLPDREPLWSLATRPRPARVAADQTLVMSLDRGEASIRYAADLVTTDGYRFQFHVAAPPQLAIDDLAVLQEDALQPVRWARDESGHVTLFLSEPLTGPAVIAIRGRLPIPVRGRFKLPKIALEAASINSSEIRIYQRDAVLADVTATNGLAVAEDAQVGLEQRGLGRLVGAYTAAVPSAAATLVISPNRPRLTGRTVTTLCWKNDAWQANFDYFFHVTEGQVEQIRLDVPSWWNGPYHVTPPATVQVVAVPGRDRHRLVIRPHTAIAGQHHLHLDAALPASDDQPLRVPHVATLNRGQVQRFLVLPTRLDHQQLVWTTRGLRPAELPPSLELPDVSLHAPHVVQVVADTFTATPETLPEVTSAPQIRLADIHLLPAAADHECLGLASFDLLPARLSSCQVRLPSNCELVQAAVEGYPAEAKQLDNSLWQLMLRSTTLPQRVEILFRTGPPTTQQKISRRDKVEALPTASTVRQTTAAPRRRDMAPWQAPVLATASGPITVQRTLWTIAQSRLSPDGVEAAAGLVDAYHQSLARLEATASVLDLPREITDQVPLDERVRWYHRWARRLQFQLDAARLAAIQTTPSMRARIQAIAAHQAEIAARLGTAAVLAEVRRSPPVALEPSELFDALLVTDVAVARFAFPSSHSGFELRRGWHWDQGLTVRLTAAAILLVASVLAMLVIRSGRYRHVAWGWPHSIMAAAGLAWWLWLRPSFAGWLLLAAVAAWTLYRGRRVALRDLPQ